MYHGGRGFDLLKERIEKREKETWLKWQSRKNINILQSSFWLCVTGDTNPDWLNNNNFLRRVYKFTHSWEVQSILPTSKTLSRGETTCSDPAPLFLFLICFFGVDLSSGKFSHDPKMVASSSKCSMITCLCPARKAKVVFYIIGQRRPQNEDH